MPTATMPTYDARVVLMFLLLRTTRSRPEDGEHLVGVRDPRLQEHRFVGLALELRHGARETEPVQQLVVTPVLGLLDRSVAPRRPIAVTQRLVITLVRLHVREHQGVLRDQERMAPAGRRDHRHAPGAAAEPARDRRSHLEAAPRLRTRRGEPGLAPALRRLRRR